MRTRWHTRRAQGIAWLGVGVLVCQTSAAFAEAVGSPASILKKGKWVMGLGGGALLERELSGGAEATVYQGGHYRGYGLTDWLSLYGKIGLAYVEVEDASIKKTNDPSTTNSFGRNFLSSVQAKIRFFRHERFDWEWDGSLQYTDLRARRRGKRGKNEIRWHDWQFATSLAKGLGRVKPYVGVKVNIIDATFRVRENGKLLTQGTYDQDGAFGFFVGSDYSLGSSEDVMLNIETSLLDGIEITAAIAYTF